MRSAVQHVQRYPGGARWLDAELDLVTRELVATARRDERRYSWRQIGAAMGTSGQAAGKWARPHDLPVDGPTAVDYAAAVEEGRALVAALNDYGPGLHGEGALDQSASSLRHRSLNAAIGSLSVP
ncbi:hypothetical protein [Actinomadura oligospora]|uniref:hypothetical protein n=1 Tax=Actinomadura oligospora TaxID=111804 RepID=UPI0004787E59|nr:hypothetical protein [Actinomadura oligospora]